MSERIGENIIISKEPPQQCDLCGTVAELRPYGPGGACICYACGQKDTKGTLKWMGMKLFGLTEAEAEQTAKELFS